MVSLCRLFHAIHLAVDEETEHVRFFKRDDVEEPVDEMGMTLSGRLTEMETSITVLSERVSQVAEALSREQSQREMEIEKYRADVRFLTSRLDDMDRRVAAQIMTMFQVAGAASEQITKLLKEARRGRSSSRR